MIALTIIMPSIEMMIMFCFVLWRLGIRVRRAIDDDLIDYTDKKIETSPWVLPEDEKEQRFNTWYVTRHRTHPPLWTAVCPAGRLPPLWVPRPHAGSRNKKKTILTNRSSVAEKTRVTRGEHARKSSAKTGTTRMLTTKSGKTVAQLRYKKHFDHFSTEHKHTSCDHTLQIRTSKILLSTPLLQSTTLTRRITLLSIRNFDTSLA